MHELEIFCLLMHNKDFNIIRERSKKMIKFFYFSYLEMLPWMGGTIGMGRPKFWKPPFIFENFEKKNCNF